MSAVFATLQQEAIDQVAREPVAAEVYLDSLALLEGLTRTVIPELEPPRFSVSALDREFDRLKTSAQSRHFDEIAANIEVNREAWARIYSFGRDGVNQLDNIARRIHGARTFREFVLDGAEAVSAVESVGRGQPPPTLTAVERSGVRLAVAQFPARIISDDLGISDESAEAVIGDVREIVSRTGEEEVLSRYHLAPDEIEPYFASSKVGVYVHTNSKGVTYFLHRKKVTLRGGREQIIYFFSKRPIKGAQASALPDAYTVTENPRNGFLTVKRR